MHYFYNLIYIKNVQEFGARIPTFRHERIN